MYNELLLEVFNIRIKIKGYIENKTEKSKEKIDTYAIKNKDKLSYKHNDTTYKIPNVNNKLINLLTVSGLVI